MLCGKGVVVTGSGRYSQCLTGKSSCSSCFIPVRVLVHFDNLLVSVLETDFWLCLPKNLGSYDDSVAVHECDCEIFFSQHVLISW